MSHCSPVKTTLPAEFKPTDGEHKTAKHLPYPQIVGSLLYAAVITRPDIAHAVSVLSCYLAKWSDSHYRAAKHPGHFRLVLGHGWCSWESNFARLCTCRLGWGSRYQKINNRLQLPGLRLNRLLEISTSTNGRPFNNGR